MINMEKKYNIILEEVIQKIKDKEEESKCKDEKTVYTVNWADILSTMRNTDYVYYTSSLGTSTYNED